MEGKGCGLVRVWLCIRGERPVSTELDNQNYLVKTRLKGLIAKRNLLGRKERLLLSVFELLSSSVTSAKSLFELKLSSSMLYLVSSSPEFAAAFPLTNIGIDQSLNYMMFLLAS